ncbi:hypothetical protein sscle_12g086960 [Sclerotinia sclerotiorum 1980 UF-70]|uniref:Uncharacterized protein n=1 Tax=Sclerotinia sclerotiorum (strain ATCC 18683 / 1980 / Ss-1) TaxID=665079 RepID=A0A1D9QG47_SCLS1|nr:hypothetical protein sscle_12g086960 [Sclerotinia sclerotiorum 1980 UF-70]
MSSARASKAAVVLSIIQFLTLVGSMGFLVILIISSTFYSIVYQLLLLARAFHNRAACSTTSAHARKIRNSRLCHHYRTSPTNHSPGAPKTLSSSAMPLSPPTNFPRQERPITLPVLRQRPEIGDTYRMRETYERNVPTQNRHRNGDERMRVRGHAETIGLERSEEE